MTVFISTPYEQDSGDFNDLPAHVWPRCAKREEDGVVTIAGVPLPEIAADYGTPVVVVDEDDFRSRCRDMATAFLAPENVLSLIHISEPTRPVCSSRMPSSA